MAQLTDLGRRVLGHLPVYAADEKAHVEAEGGPEESVRSYSLAAFTVRLAEDPFTITLTASEVEQSLRGLEDAGLAKEKAGEWRMTKAGLDALQAPDEPEQQVAGAVVVDLAPATSDSKALGG